MYSKIIVGWVSLFVKHFTLDWDRDIDHVLKNNSREGKSIYL